MADPARARLFHEYEVARRKLELAELRLQISRSAFLIDRAAVREAEHWREQLHLLGQAIVAPPAETPIEVITGGKAQLLRHLQWSVDYHQKLRELADAGAIVLTPIGGPGRKFRMEILKPELAYRRTQGVP